MFLHFAPKVQETLEHGVPESDKYEIWARLCELLIQRESMIFPLKV